ncbi:hypothetical protein SAMN00017405_1118 [Desulfonispora thiosulfatigenes DSM 11270]|uniref:Uncharacterized protein n=1 Tax=Desulfonispora thiosulfatigenes DSM 11270 TaxID=656914 RepID=A0A1W1UYE7_DESTI|nr:hypothetical protein [Desulfonispora thiosulfatigenes]SMB86106.1 hypothetical protein SAMN00017405_1118 [Desulfonispora thiosulfatigenes DSM 11270]
MKKVWLKVFLVVIVIWLVITIYFYNQHKISIKRCVVDTKVNYEGNIIKFDELVLTDRKPNYIEFDGWHFKVGTRLPRFLQKPFLATSYFYRKPYRELQYNEDKKYGIIELRGTLIRENLDEKYFDSIRDKIDLIDDQGVSLPLHRDGMEFNESTFFFYKQNSFFDKSIEQITIGIKDNNDNIVTTIPIKLKWQIENYNYFNRMPKWDFYLDSQNTVREFITRKKANEDYLDLFHEQGQNIDLENLKHDYWQNIIYSNSANYIGNYKNWKDVYLSQLEFMKDNEQLVKQEIYLIDAGKTFNIIESSPVKTEKH